MKYLKPWPTPASPPRTDVAGMWKSSNRISVSDALVAELAQTGIGMLMPGRSASGCFSTRKPVIPR